MTTEDKNRKLHQILGLHWHEAYDVDFNSDRRERFFVCRICGRKYLKDNPNTNFYEDAGTVQLLRELEKSPIGQKFFSDALYNGDYIEFDYSYIHKELITITSLLADKVIEWRENGNNN